jgi:hypothetical protein
LSANAASRSTDPSPSHDLVPPKHLWQFGLREPAGRFFESICVPLLFDAAFRRFVIDAQSLLGPEYTLVPVEVAHVTLGGVENATVPWNQALFRADFADVESIALSEYSIRIVLQERPFAELAAAFGVPKATRPYGVTLAYAGVRIPAERAAETLGAINRAFLGARPLRVGFEYVEAQRRPLPSREPFRYLRTATARGST